MKPSYLYHSFWMSIFSTLAMMSSCSSSDSKGKENDCLDGVDCSPGPGSYFYCEDKSVACCIIHLDYPEADAFLSTERNSREADKVRQFLEDNNLIDCPYDEVTYYDLGIDLEYLDWSISKDDDYFNGVFTGVRYKVSTSLLCMDRDMRGVTIIRGAKILHQSVSEFTLTMVDEEYAIIDGLDFFGFVENERYKVDLSNLDPATCGYSLDLTLVGESENSLPTLYFTSQE